MQTGDLHENELYSCHELYSKAIETIMYWIIRLYSWTSPLSKCSDCSENIM